MFSSLSLCRLNPFVLKCRSRYKWCWKPWLIRTKQSRTIAVVVSRTFICSCLFNLSVWLENSLMVSTIAQTMNTRASNGDVGLLEELQSIWRQKLPAFRLRLLIFCFLFTVPLEVSFTNFEMSSSNVVSSKRRQSCVHLL